jgi:hypothetical protein
MMNERRCRFQQTLQRITGVKDWIARSRGLLLSVAHS